MATAQELLKGDGLASIRVGDVCVTLWRDPATAERVTWLCDHLLEFAHRQPGDILHFMLILSSSSPPGSEARAVFQKSVIALDEGKKLRKFIVVAVGNMFWSNIVRTVGRTILFLAGKGHLLALFANLNDGLVAVQGHASERTPKRAEIVNVVAALAAALNVNPPEIAEFTKPDSASRASA